MRRRSGRLSEIAAKATPIKLPSPSKKRQQPSDSDEDMDATPRPSKTQKRQPSANATPKKSPKKSPHFSKLEISSATGLTSEESLSATDADDASAYDTDGAASPLSSASEPEDDDDSEDDFSASSADGKDKKAFKRKPVAKSNAKAKPKTARGKGQEIWREGAKIGFEPGTEVVFKKPKARPAGNTEYRDQTVHPNTMLFLADLKRNNDREWLKINDPDFRQSEKDFRSFIEHLTERLVEVDDTVPELPVKDIVYRIYRDVRFSKDQTPYKSYFSAAWSRTGRKGPYAVYYLQIAPGTSFFGGGCWHPESQSISRLRTDIDRRPRRLKDVLMADSMRKQFLNGAPKNEAKVIKEFVTNRTNKENALKVRPQVSFLLFLLPCS